jgi:hydroxymethylpyrimidine/phosphomethylpyrimidine kinase
MTKKSEAIMMGEILTIGRFDPRARTGVQRDLRTVTRLGGRARTIATYSICPDDPSQVLSIPVSIVEAQMKGIMDENVRCIKIGSLIGPEMMEMIADFIEKGEGKGIPLILEPVMTSSRGARQVLDHTAVQAFERRLFFHADLLCPNLTEAYRLTGVRVVDLETMRYVAEMLMTLGNKAVLLTGGSLSGSEVYDVFMESDSQEVFSSPRLGRSEAGSGDALTSAIAVGIACGKTLREAVVDARAYVQDVIKAYIARSAQSDDDAWGGVTSPRVATSSSSSASPTN